jgi:predicted NodU family carbamoyl transferase
MEILGANIGETSEGVRLKDGSVTSITDGTVTMSIPEDRVSREKYKGGFCGALEFMLSRRGRSICDIDRLYISTLGEE